MVSNTRARAHTHSTCTQIYILFYEKLIANSTDPMTTPKWAYIPIATFHLAYAEKKSFLSLVVVVFGSTVRIRTTKKTNKMGTLPVHSSSILKIS